ncbi:MAG: hypothetical protein ACTHMC_17610 [Pseudobacter sp.]|uniref:hypothetical protein n=1 Tax=Pseudobacter sp. TaxID=2045420 RepID=UPI003F7F41B0
MLLNSYAHITMIRVTFLSSLLLMIMVQSRCQPSTRDTMVTGKLVAFISERIPATTDYWRTAFKFLVGEHDTATINVPTDSLVPRALFHSTFGFCQLRVDSVYTLKLKYTKLGEIFIGLKNTPGFFYNDNDIVEDPVTGKIFANPKAVRAKSRGGRIMGANYLDMNGFIYELIDYWPYPCAKRHF